MTTLLHLWADAPPGDERPEQGEYRFDYARRCIAGH
jgi:hypothetical protein